MISLQFFRKDSTPILGLAAELPKFGTSDPIKVITAVDLGWETINHDSGMVVTRPYIRQHKTTKLLVQGVIHLFGWVTINDDHKFVAAGKILELESLQRVIIQAFEHTRIKKKGKK
ncbi:MAG TPA: hypothetical protein DHN29_12935 [Cytophagales bacterium]|nr:hypothetical protein [Cytophagales bacterium]|tara:strand:- start:736 stop:1083 length:348 start_codon:yes stop_codon:yes gene_type:complete